MYSVCNVVIETVAPPLVHIVSRYSQTILVSKAPARSFSADSISVFSLHSLDILDFQSKRHNPGH